MVLGCSSAFEVGEQKFEPARYRIDVSRLGEQGELAVQFRDHGEEGWREWRGLDKIVSKCREV